MDEDQKIALGVGAGVAIAIGGVLVYMATKKKPSVTTPPARTVTPPTTTPPKSVTIQTPPNYYYISNPNSSPATVIIYPTYKITPVASYQIPANSSAKIPVPSGYQNMFISNVVNGAYIIPSKLPAPLPGSKWSIGSVQGLKVYTLTNASPYTLFVVVTNPQLIQELFYVVSGKAVKFYANTNWNLQATVFGSLETVCSFSQLTTTNLVCK